jgi:hypothetical protein
MPNADADAFHKIVPRVPGYKISAPGDYRFFGPKCAWDQCENRLPQRFPSSEFLLPRFYVMHGRADDPILVEPLIYPFQMFLIVEIE